MTLQQSLSDALAQTQQAVRKKPMEYALREQLFQLFCLCGDWQRALRQLQTCVRLRPEFYSNAQLYRGLLRAEQLRRECLVGTRQPRFILQQPEWMQRLIEAIALNNNAKHNEADTCREAALNDAPDVSGSANDIPFTWITDTDSWFGPILELVIGGQYTWLPFSQLRRLKGHLPETGLDLIWKPVTVTLEDNNDYHGYLFTRYSGSEHADDVLRLCRETQWHEDGVTSVRALGQKMWQTDNGDISALDLTVMEIA